MDDCISRKAAIDALAEYIHNVDKVMGTGHLTAYDCKDAAASVFEELPSAQPEITLESAIDYLHSIGWMQEHDRTLTESAQPEIIHCESCEHWKNEHLCECLSRYGTFETPKNFYCGYGKRRTDAE